MPGERRTALLLRSRASARSSEDQFCRSPRRSYCSPPLGRILMRVMQGTHAPPGTSRVLYTARGVLQADGLRGFYRGIVPELCKVRKQLRRLRPLPRSCSLLLASAFPLRLAPLHAALCHPVLTGCL